MGQREEAEAIRRVTIEGMGKKADLVKWGDLIPCPDGDGFYFLFQTPEMTEPKKVLLQRKH